MPDFKDYNDKQLIKTVDTLLEEIEERDIVDKFKKETTSHGVLMELAETYFLLRVLMRAGDKYREQPGVDDDASPEPEELNRFVRKDLVWEEFTENCIGSLSEEADESDNEE